MQLLKLDDASEYLGEQMLDAIELCSMRGSEYGADGFYGRLARIDLTSPPERAAVLLELEPKPEKNVVQDGGAAGMVPVHDCGLI